MDFGSLAYTYPWAGPAAAQTFKVDNEGLPGPKFSLWPSGLYNPEGHSENFGSKTPSLLTFRVWAAASPAYTYKPSINNQASFSAFKF